MNTQPQFWPSAEELFPQRIHLNGNKLCKYKMLICQCGQENLLSLPTPEAKDGAYTQALPCIHCQSYLGTLRTPTISETQPKKVRKNP
jgi:hypothetical protein